jgi:GntR family transcriptional repressor for pyruvate dehydrogenase complex
MQNSKIIRKLRPIKRRRLYEDIVEQIKLLIKEGKLKSGDQIPSERELCDIFKVSRNSVREAIRILEEYGILNSRIGDGTYVIIGSEGSLVKPFAKLIHDEKSKLFEIFQFRSIIEPNIAALAAEYASAQDIRKLEQILKNQKKQLRDAERSVDLDDKFHIMIARATRNAILLTVVERINDLIAESRAEYLQNDIRRKKSLAGHTKILSAIMNREPAAAQKAMRDHIKSIEFIALNQKLQVK